VVTTKLHKAIPMVGGANACAALKHSLLVVGFYFILFSFLWGVQQTLQQGS